jgi:ABC-type sugar transport system substrate-binding protein
MTMNRILSTALAAAALALTAGCGSSSSPDVPMGGGPVLVTPASPDSFTQSVQAIAAVSNDRDTPAATEGFVPVANDTSSPIAVY